MEYPIITGVDLGAFPENRGRVEGSKNHTTARRDEAVAKGASYVEVNGMKLNEASDLIITEFRLAMTTAHMAKMIRNYRKANTST